MQKKIETMVKGVGELSLEAISTWFPSKSKESIISEIQKSDKLEIIKNMVVLKGNMTREQKNAIKKEISFGNIVEPKILNVQEVKTEVAADMTGSISAKETIIDAPYFETTPKTNMVKEEIKPIYKEEVKPVFKEENKPAFKEEVKSYNENVKAYNEEKVEPKKEEKVEHVNPSIGGKITYGELVELIASYNKTVKEKYETLRTCNHENITKAVIKYYETRYDVVKQPLSICGADVYSLNHKKNGIEVAYCLIGQKLTEEMLTTIEEKFKNDTLYLCILGDIQAKPKVDFREFYLKDIQGIVEDYVDRYKLETIEHSLLKLEGKKEEEVL